MKQLLWILVVVVLVAGGIFLFRSKSGTDSGLYSNATTSDTTSNTNTTSSTSVKGYTIAMKKSTNISKNKQPLTVDIFEKSMASIAKSFLRVDERLEKIDERLEKHDRMFETILLEIRNLHEDNKYIRNTLSALVRQDAKDERKMEDMLVRIERLEAKVLV